MLPTKYLYKIYNIAGQYLGNLPTPSSDLRLTNDINTIGASITLTVPATFDVAPLPVQPIETEDGQPITTEAGEVITTEGASQIIGQPDSLIKNGNGIVIWEYNSTNPNGVVKYNGYISSWKLSTSSEQVAITCIPNGVDLDQYITRLPYARLAYTGGLSYPTAINIYANRSLSSAEIAGINYFQMDNGTRLSTISGASIQLAAQNASSPATVTVYLQSFSNSVPPTARFDPNQSYASATATVTSTSPTAIDFIFNRSLTPDSNSIVFFLIICSAPAGSGVTTYLSTAYGFNDNTEVNDNGSVTKYNSIVYAPYLLYVTNETRVPFSNTDPGQIIRTAMDYYAVDGGTITYTPSSVQLTGIANFSVTFQVNTILEVINTCLAAAPANWYWYVDASNILYFKPASTIADHTFVKGVHLQEFEVTETIEDIKNVSYFSGGDPGSGVNVFVKTQNTAGLKTQRRGLARTSNNRVIDTTAAGLLAQAEINRNNSAKYPTTIDILASTYDLNTIKIGQMVQFRGWGIALIDSLLLQIMNISYTPDSARITLGMLQNSEGNTVEDLRRQLAQAQTVDNPALPS